MLPDHDVVVIDEAHDLVDRITSVATEELSGASIAMAARRCGRLIDQDVADRLAEASDGLAMILEDMPAGRSRRTAAGRLRGRWPRRRDAAHNCVSSLGGERKEDPEGATARKLALALLEEVHDCAVRVLEAFDEEHDVVWVSGDYQQKAPTLRVAPLGVGGLLRERLFAKRTTVLTSATLTLGGAFDTMARQWGLPPSEKVLKIEGAATDKGIDGPKWTGLDVGSPFEHGTSGILYVARQLPQPGRDGLPPGVPRRDRGPGERGRWPCARASSPRRERPSGHGSVAGQARLPDPLPGRRLDRPAGEEVRRGRAHVPVRHAVAVAGRGRAGAQPPARDHGPDPVPTPGRPAGLRPPEGGQLSRRQRLPDGRGDPRRPAAGPGRGPVAAVDVGQGRGGHPGPDDWPRPATAASSGPHSRRSGRPTTPRWSAARSSAWTRPSVRPPDPFDQLVAVLLHVLEFRFVAGRPLQRTFQDLQPLAFVAVRVRQPAAFSMALASLVVRLGFLAAPC